MIIWINGTYGVGKTAVANKVKELLAHKNITIIDADEVFEQHAEVILKSLIFYGGGLLPQTNKTAIYFLKQEILPYTQSEDICIIPMTITTNEGLTLLWNDVCENTTTFYHFILDADEETIKTRIKSDETRQQKDLALSDLSLNINFLKNNFSDAIRINTTNMRIDDIAQQIIDTVIHKK